MEFIEMAQQVASPLLVAGLTWLAARVAGWIRSRVRNEVLQGILHRLEDAVVTAVKDLQQTVVDELRECSVDGRLGPDAKARVKQAAIEQEKDYLGARGLAELMQVLGLSAGTVDEFIGSKVEAAVHDLKKQRRHNGVEHDGAWQSIPSA